MSKAANQLLMRIVTLNEVQVLQVGRFIDSLLLGEDIELVKASGTLSEHSFAEVWNNPQDDVYDAL